VGSGKLIWILVQYKREQKGKNVKMSKKGPQVAQKCQKPQVEAFRGKMGRNWTDQNIRGLAKTKGPLGTSN
jgi:hypothetical protein